MSEMQTIKIFGNVRYRNVVAAGVLLAGYGRLMDFGRIPKRRAGRAATPTPP